MSAEQPECYAIEQRGRRIVARINAASERTGLRCGMPLALANLRCGSLNVYDFEPLQDGLAMQKLRRWCRRYSPKTAIDPTPANPKQPQPTAEGLLLDITTTREAYGGEQSLAICVHKDLGRIGYTPRIGIGPTVGTAWAAARYACGNQPFARLDPEDPRVGRLPIAALRLPAETIDRLHTVGVETVAELQRIPRASLHRRVPDALTKLDRFLGRTPETIESPAPSRNHQERWNGEVSIGNEHELQIILKQLVYRLSSPLIQDGAAIAEIQWRITHENSAAIGAAFPDARDRVVFAKPTRDKKHICSILTRAILGKMRSPINGIDLIASSVSPTHRQNTLHEAVRHTTAGTLSLHQLLDRLSADPQLPSPQRMRPQASNDPKHINTMGSIETPSKRIGQLPRYRPSVIFSEPISITIEQPLSTIDSSPAWLDGQTIYLRRTTREMHLAAPWWSQSTDTPADACFITAQQIDGPLLWIRQNAGEHKVCGVWL